MVYTGTTNSWPISASDSSSATCPSSITYSISHTTSSGCSSVNVPNSFTISKGGTTSFTISVTPILGQECSLTINIIAPDGTVVDPTFTVKVSGEITASQATVSVGDPFALSVSGQTGSPREMFALTVLYSNTWHYCCCDDWCMQVVQEQGVYIPNSGFCASHSLLTCSNTWPISESTPGTYTYYAASYDYYGPTGGDIAYREVKPATVTVTGCLSNADCPASKPYCSVFDNKCHECLNNANPDGTSPQCAVVSPSKPYCLTGGSSSDPMWLTCVECLSSGTECKGTDGTWNTYCPKGTGTRNHILPFCVTNECRCAAECSTNTECTTNFCCTKESPQGPGISPGTCESVSDIQNPWLCT